MRQNGVQSAVRQSLSGQISIGLKRTQGNGIRHDEEGPGRHKLFRFLCDNIDNWRDFGRCFEMKDVDLSRIGQDPELHNDQKLIIHRILERSVETFNDQFESKLCEALAEARRKDLLRELKKFKLINDLP